MRAKNQRKDQCGAILVFGMAFLLLVFGIGALIVDILRIERAARSLQRAADAAALAGASQFKRSVGTIEEYNQDTLNGWRQAKRIAILALRLNPIFGDDGEIVNSSLNNHSGIQDSFHDDGGKYSYTDYNFQSLDVKIERVFYYRQISTCPDTAGIPAERALDGLQYCSTDGISPPCVPLGCCVNPIISPLFSPQVSNGVRVTLTLKNLPLIFGRFVGLSKLATLTRTALGAPSIPLVGAADEACPP